MSRSGLLHKIQGFLSGHRDPGTAAPQAPHEATREAENAALPATVDPAAAAPAAPAAATDKLDRLSEAIEAQRREIDTAVQRFSGVSASFEQMLGGGDGIDASNRMREVLSRLSDRTEESASAIQDLAAEAERHGESLDKIQASLSAISENSLQLGAVARSLSEAVAGTNRDNAAHVQLMEQVRDHFVESNDELAQTVAAQARRFTGLIVVVISLLAILDLVMIYRALAGH